MNEHLGGFQPGGDPATFFPELWIWLVNEFGIRSVLDVGCGDGVAVEYFKQLGIKADGVEGTFQNNPSIEQWDFENGPFVPKGHYDLIWTCEFLEHLEERFVGNLVPVFSSGYVVLVTHAYPGQLGYHHVNCRYSDYWKGFFNACGMVFSQELTDKAKTFARINKHPKNHFERSGMAFVKI